MTASSQPAPTSSTPRPRKRWAAAAFSILLPGLGHLYAGAHRRALVAFAAYLISVTALVHFTAAWPYILVFASGLGLTTLLIVSIVWDSVRTARRAAPLFALRAYNRWFVYTGALLAWVLVLSPLFYSFLTSSLQAYQMPSVSMEPTLLRGDYVLARPLRRPPSRGHIVVYKDRVATHIKRVVGLPTDTVSMRRGALFVNGDSVPEPYIATSLEPDISDTQFLWQRRVLAGNEASLAYDPTRDTWGPLLVPTRAYFVLGDNRGYSYDSRYVGSISSDSVTQEPVLIYLSWDRDNGVRWDRIGIRLF